MICSWCGRDLENEFDIHTCRECGEELICDDCYSEEAGTVCTTCFVNPEATK